MKKLHTCLVVLLLSITFIFSSCTNRDKRTNSYNEQSSDEALISALNEADIVKQADDCISTYLYMKDALVNEDTATATEAGNDLMKQLENYRIESYETSDQEKLKKIIEDAAQHAKYISENSLEIQREHFDMLSKNIIDLIDITGTTKKLYQFYCPMYNNDKGAQWLSDSEDIQNPYFGKEMMTCGVKQREIN